MGMCVGGSGCVRELIDVSTSKADASEAETGVWGALKITNVENMFTLELDLLVSLVGYESLSIK